MRIRFRIELDVTRKRACKRGTPTCAREETQADPREEVEPDPPIIDHYPPTLLENTQPPYYPLGFTPSTVEATHKHNH